MDYEKYLYEFKVTTCIESVKVYVSNIHKHKYIYIKIQIILLVLVLQLIEYWFNGNVTQVITIMEHK